MKRLPLFVFGTLRQGGVNHRLLDGHYERMLTATLWNFERVAPLMIAPCANRQIDGELFFLRGPDYTETLRRCDRLEGIPTGKVQGAYYERREVTVETVEGTYHAWAYVRPDCRPSEGWAGSGIPR